MDDLPIERYWQVVQYPRALDDLHNPGRNPAYDHEKSLHGQFFTGGPFMSSHGTAIVYHNNIRVTLQNPQTQIVSKLPMS